MKNTVSQKELAQFHDYMNAFANEARANKESNDSPLDKEYYDGREKAFELAKGFMTICFGYSPELLEAVNNA